MDEVSRSSGGRQEPTASEPLASLPVVLDLVRGERSELLQHLQSVENKAGIVLGFAAVLFGLGPDEGLLSVVGRVLAGLAAVYALTVFWPRKYPALQLQALRDNYLTKTAADTNLSVLDTLVDMVDKAKDVHYRKSVGLRVATGCLFAAVLSFAVATLVPIC